MILPWLLPRFCHVFSRVSKIFHNFSSVWFPLFFMLSIVVPSFFQSVPCFFYCFSVVFMFSMVIPSFFPRFSSVFPLSPHHAPPGGRGLQEGIRIGVAQAWIHLGAREKSRDFDLVKLGFYGILWEVPSGKSQFFDGKTTGKP